MPIDRLLIANRGEIAVRIARAAAEVGATAVLAASDDDRQAPHLDHGDEVVTLPGSGPAVYLDVDAVVGAAVSTGCDALHPGYGFISERADLARACEAAGVVFVGPTAATLETLGDKTAGRALAASVGVEVIEGTGPDPDEAEARAFLAGLGPGAAVVVKAVSGGGGRGMTGAVTNPRYDPLLAKVLVSHPSPVTRLRRGRGPAPAGPGRGPDRGCGHQHRVPAGRGRLGGVR